MWPSSMRPACPSSTTAWAASTSSATTTWPATAYALVRVADGQLRQARHGLRHLRLPRDALRGGAGRMAAARGRGRRRRAPMGFYDVVQKGDDCARRDVLRRHPHPEGRELGLRRCAVAGVAGFRVRWPTPTRAPADRLTWTWCCPRAASSNAPDAVGGVKCANGHILAEPEGARPAVRKQVGLLHREGHRRGHGAGRPVPGRWRGVRPGASDHR